MSPQLGMCAPELPMHRALHLAHLFQDALPEHAAYETGVQPGVARLCKGHVTRQPAEAALKRDQERSCRRTGVDTGVAASSRDVSRKAGKHPERA
jgi:hypothetical protein